MPFVILLVMWLSLSMFVHIVDTFQDGNIMFMLVGIVFPPVGFLNGSGVMFGIW